MISHLERAGPGCRGFAVHGPWPQQLTAWRSTHLVAGQRGTTPNSPNHDNVTWSFSSCTMHTSTLGLPLDIASRHSPFPFESDSPAVVKLLPRTSHCSTPAPLVYRTRRRHQHLSVRPLFGPVHHNERRGLQNVISGGSDHIIASARTSSVRPDPTRSNRRPLSTNASSQGRFPERFPSLRWMVYCGNDGS